MKIVFWFDRYSSQYDIEIENERLKHELRMSLIRTNYDVKEQFED